MSYIKTIHTRDYSSLVIHRKLFWKMLQAFINVISFPKAGQTTAMLFLHTFPTHPSEPILKRGWPACPDFICSSLPQLGTFFQFRVSISSSLWLAHLWKLLSLQLPPKKSNQKSNQPEKLAKLRPLKLMWDSPASSQASGSTDYPGVSPAAFAWLSPQLIWVLTWLYGSATRTGVFPGQGRQRHWLVNWIRK